MKTLAIAALLASTCGSALAADLPSRPAPYAPAPVAAGYNWSGFYLGANGGYGWGSTSATVGATTIDLEDLRGPFAGGQVGYNFQSGAFVFGIEGDGQWANIENTTNAFGLSLTDRINWFSTLRARAGVAMNNVLIYGTGGGVYGGFESVATLGAVTASASESRFGWTAGGGIEVGFGQWSAKAEYLYLRSFDETTTLFGTAIDSRVDAHTAKFGINYHLNGGNAVTAAY